MSSTCTRATQFGHDLVLRLLKSFKSERPMSRRAELPAYEHLMPFVIGDGAMNTYVRLIDDGCDQIDAMDLVRTKNRMLSELAGKADGGENWFLAVTPFWRPALQTPGGFRASWYQNRRIGAMSVMFYRTQTPHLLDEPCNTCATLRLHCRENRIKGRSKMRKKQMIQALMSL